MIPIALKKGFAFTLSKSLICKGRILSALPSQKTLLEAVIAAACSTGF